MVSSFFHETFNIVCESAPYLLLGFIFAGIVKFSFSSRTILSHIRQNSFRSILIASISGIPLPLCSCSVLPTAFALRKEGASKGATVSFLISTPETGIDSIGITWGLMDPLMAVYRPVCALITSLIAGIVTNVSEGKLEKKGMVSIPLTQNQTSSGIPRVNDDPSFKSKLFRIYHYAFVELMDDIVVWLILGFLLAGLITSLIPDSFFYKSLGNDWVSMLAILGISIPLYICASASTPIAAALVMKGLSPGAALVLLLAGPATNAATIPLLLKILGKKVTLIYFVVIAFTSVFFGMILNALYHWIYSTGPVYAVGTGLEKGPGVFSLVFFFLLIFLLAASLKRKWTGSR